MTTLEFTRLNLNHQGLLYQMVSQDIDEAVLTLGISTAPPIGLTVNVPTGHVIKDDGGRSRKWCALRPSEQVRWYVRDYLPRVILPFIERGIVIFELTKKQQIHCHMICWDPSIKFMIDMVELRVTINNCVLTNSICKGRIENAKILNCVHFLSDTPDWIDYLKKSQHDFVHRRFMYPYIWNHWPEQGYDNNDTSLREISNLIIDEEPQSAVRAEGGATTHFELPKALNISFP